MQENNEAQNAVDIELTEEIAEVRTVILRLLRIAKPNLSLILCV